MKRLTFALFTALSCSATGAAGREVRAVALQPSWNARHYRTLPSFRAWMRGQLEEARPHLAADRPNLVVLTELNGLPLVLRGAQIASRAPTLTSALALLLVKHLPAVLYLAAREQVSLPRALQLALAPRVAADYLLTCRDLAREYRVYLVCGTVPLPHFERRGARLVAAGGKVYNEAVLLSPDGALVGLADKVYLTADEGPSGLDFAPGRRADLAVFPTPVGDLAVATSLDAFKSDVIAHLSEGGATVLLQPDANGSPWTGVEQEPPTGRDQPEAWLDSAWRAVQHSPTLRYAINPMVVGNLFDLAFDGQSAITAKAGEAPQPRGYVMTPPRPGFLALLPWVTSGPHDELRRIGQELAPRSGSARENTYLSGVLAADLRLPPQTRPPHTLRPFEAALNDYLAGRATLAPDPAVRTLNAVWPAAALALALSGLWQLRRGHRKRGGAALVLGALLSVLAAL